MDSKLRESPAVGLCTCVEPASSVDHRLRRSGRVTSEENVSTHGVDADEQPLAVEDDARLAIKAQGAAHTEKALVGQ